MKEEDIIEGSIVDQTGARHFDDPKGKNVDIFGNHFIDREISFDDSDDESEQ